MATSQPNDEISSSDLLHQYIQCGQNLLERCHQQKHVQGIQKLEKKCQAEVRFLKSLENTAFDECRLKSSNLSHYAALVHAIENAFDVTQVVQPFSCTSRTESLHVDVVALKGLAWIKVVARKAQALHLIWAGQGQFGERDLLFQAQDFVECSSEHPVNFAIPRVFFSFYNGITVPMAKALEDIGVTVLGQQVPVAPDIEDKLLELSLADSDDSEDDDSEFIDKDVHVTSSLSIPHRCIDTTEYTPLSTSSDNIVQHSGQITKDLCAQQSASEGSKSGKDLDHMHGERSLNQSLCMEGVTSVDQFVKKELLTCELIDYGHMLGAEFSNRDNDIDTITNVNLDITALITLVSAMTHGRCNFVFPEKILSQQATEERQKPALPSLKKFLKGKKQFACQTAVDSFHEILAMLGGKSEIERAKELLENVTVVNDSPSQQAMNLPETSKIKKRSKIIFGTGDTLKAVTVTANSGFVRAAEHQGVKFAVFLHASRALTEKKEQYATPIQ
ncbi:hypothetical protein CHS0354_030940 [Potamilus streckersoni]|uniref:DUF1308 domain-containing protein n=1 Tax=Potamilus streckersoni TaxID=2493646 RepID=A0AAE0RYD2_9BIVA|nr:hypothetical protein CHS0354_030940 [Potamilus streckersoni]